MRPPLRYLTAGAGATLFAVLLLSAPPRAFPRGESVVIPRGVSASQIAKTLGDEGVVVFPAFFSLLLRVSGAAESVRAGAYRFDRPQSAMTVAYRIANGDYGIPPARITLLEGETVRGYARTVAAVLPEISEAEFLRAAEKYEGYLFPDTYTFLPDATAESVVRTARNTFTAKIEPLEAQIRASGHTLSDIVVMASLLEKEARTSESRRMIAGILWRRLELKMPLQVDAVFGYIFQRDTYSPSFADLKVDSPYNTYTHLGLPPGPIGNPGLVSIEAALNPTKSDYLYYLTGKDGLMHYAKTYNGHLANQQNYLK